MANEYQVVEVAAEVVRSGPTGGPPAQVVEFGLEVLRGSGATAAAQVSEVALEVLRSVATLHRRRLIITSG